MYLVVINNSHSKEFYIVEELKAELDIIKLKLKELEAEISQLKNKPERIANIVQELKEEN